MAMHNAGYGYQVGVGGKKDKSKAINYYTRRLRKLEAQGRSRISQNCLAARGNPKKHTSGFAWQRL